jgi:hypothetical protein
MSLLTRPQRFYRAAVAILALWVGIWVPLCARTFGRGHSLARIATVCTLPGRHVSIGRRVLRRRHAGPTLVGGYGRCCR